MQLKFLRLINLFAQLQRAVADARHIQTVIHYPDQIAAQPAADLANLRNPAWGVVNHAE